MKKTAYTHEEFVNKVSTINPTIVVTSKYNGVENKIEIECSHLGKNIVYAYSLLKPRHCCRKGYHANRIPAMKKDVESRKLEYSAIFGNTLDFSQATLGKPQQLNNIHCNIHDIKFNQWYNSLKQGIGCPQCGKEKKRIAGINSLGYARKVAAKVGKAVYISKSETKWLDSLAIPVRQYWLPDVKYRVDGFNPDTNTVYLYHGRFWHGCPEKYDPDEIHPILKVKMKQLYEQTVSWENKIKEAGYNLIIKWGK